MFIIRSMIRYSPCVGARAVSARERLHHTTKQIANLAVKRKQLSFTEVELGIIVDALATQWWSRYDPEVENMVAQHHNLLNRVITAQKSLLNDEPTERA